MDWLDFSFDETIRDFEYTKRAALKMNRIIDSSEFEDMDAERIFNYLANEMEVVIFPDYLKRYIYEKLEIDAPFAEVPMKVYQDIISTALTENNAPYSFTPTTTKKTAMIKLWLTQPGAKRSVIFVLGFALCMTCEEVSEFLTKVIKEEDVNFEDPNEVIYWYCFKQGLPYAAAARLIQAYESMPSGDYSEKKWSSMRQAPEIYLLSEQNLMTYLKLLKAKGISDAHALAAYAAFEKLYRQCQDIISEMYNKEGDLVSQKKHWTPEDIKPADIEKVLCSGIPVNAKKNLESMAASRFKNLFQNRRMSRQRISSILNKKHPVERFDLITLLFYIYAQTVEPDWPAERYLQYIDAINEILSGCGMLGIYPVNPYEAFILMCIVTEYPMDVYAEIWEKSYEDGI